MKIPTDENFGAMVRECRELRQWSMTEFASKLRDAGLTNFHPTTISRLERGERPVKLGEASVIAQVLGTPLGDLVDIPMEPWEELKADLEEHGERTEIYAKWSAYWGVAMAEFGVDALRLASELEQAIRDNAVPADEIEDSLRLIEKYRELVPQDRIGFWRDHIASLSTEEQDAFRNEHVSR